MGFSRFAVGREPDAVLLGRITAGLWSYRRPNRKEGFYMDKIRIITDTSSDISVEDAERWDIELLPVLFQIDGKPCYESIDFTNEEFYEMMPEYEKMTAVQIPAAVYLDRYDKALPPWLYRCGHRYGRQLFYDNLACSRSGTGAVLRTASGRTAAHPCDRFQNVFHRVRRGSVASGTKGGRRHGVC